MTCILLLINHLSPIRTARASMQGDLWAITGTRLKVTKSAEAAPHDLVHTGQLNIVRGDTSDI